MMSIQSVFPNESQVFVVHLGAIHKDWRVFVLSCGSSWCFQRFLAFKTQNNSVKSTWFDLEVRHHFPDPDMAVSFWRGQAQTWLESPHRTEVWHSFFRTLFCACFDFQTPQKNNPIIATFPLCNNRRFIQKIMERVCTYCIFPATSVNVKEPPSHLSETQTNTFTPRLFLVYSFNQRFLLKFKQQHLFLLEAKTSVECQKREGNVILGFLLRIRVMSSLQLIYCSKCNILINYKSCCLPLTMSR